MKISLKNRLALLVALGAFAARMSAASPLSDQPLSGDTVPVSAHVHAIIGWPNVGIVVGAAATLVVDTGLGKANGATVAAAARKPKRTARPSPPPHASSRPLTASI